MAHAIQLALSNPTLIVGAVFLAVAIQGRVSRARVQRFATRQSLRVTEANGNQVIRYLATTRRWRTVGLLVGLLVSQATQNLRLGRISTGDEWIIVFVGWFIGALVAEARVAQLAHGQLRAASLQPRRPQQYGHPVTWALVPGATTAALGVGAATALVGAAGWGRPDARWATTWLVAALMVAVTVRLGQHVVARRAQPHAAPELIAADDAIRSRSLHVLSGGGAALVVFMVLNQLGSLHLHEFRVGTVEVRESMIYTIRIFGAFITALAGWLVAVTTWMPAPGQPSDLPPAVRAGE